MNTLNTTFYLQEHRMRQDGTAPIVARVTIDSKRVDIPTGIKLKPNQWDKTNERVVGKSPETSIADNKLSLIKAKILNAYNYLLTRDEPTAKAVKELVVHGKKKKQEENKIPGVLFLFEEHNSVFEKLVEKDDKAKGSLTKYTTVKKHIDSFLNGRDIPVDKVDINFLEDFHQWLITEQDIAHNTTVKYIGAFGKIIRKAKKKGYIKNDPTDEYDYSVREKAKVFLELEEVRKIEETEIIVPHLDRVRDYFIFACYTGMAYIDVKEFDESQIVHLMDMDWVFKDRGKTNVTARIPLLDKAKAMVEKYKDRPKRKEGQGVFPIPTNQRTNEYLKTVALIAGIRKNITFHTARHTFATTIALANGIELKDVSTMLGHTNVKQTEHYAKVVNSRLASEMKRLNSILSE